MIRRRDGNDWLLISQIDHAHLSADVAAVWGTASITPLSMPDELLPAIRHHDDGWAEWESSPTVDPETGKPRDFTEMPMPVAIDIWTCSIARCAERSPWAGLWVSGHFCALASRASESRKECRDDHAALRCFVDVQQNLQTEFRALIGEPLLEDRIALGIRHVQFFDRVSLWICCASRDKPSVMTTAAGESVEFTPHDKTACTVSPQALSADIEFSVAARRIPARKYVDNRDLQTALKSAAPEILTWTLRNATE